MKCRLIVQKWLFFAWPLYFLSLKQGIKMIIKGVFPPDLLENTLKWSVVRHFRNLPMLASTVTVRWTNMCPEGGLTQQNCRYIFSLKMSTLISGLIKVWGINFVSSWNFLFFWKTWKKIFYRKDLSYFRKSFLFEVYRKKTFPILFF